MKIGPIDFGERPLFLAPMEDVTDIGFRRLCKRFGASMVYTEFVSAEALVRDVKSTVKKLTISDDERPVGIQIYGRDTEAMVEAAKIVEQAGPDLIDLNFGCPVKKVAGKGAGAGMLQNIPKMLEITRCRPSAGHGQDPSGLEPRATHHHYAGRAVTGLRHPGADHPRSHPQSDVYGRGRLDAHWRGEAQSPHPHSHYWQWRYPFHC